MPVAVNTSGVLAGKTVTAIAAGYAHTCAVANDKAYCWGDNDRGQLGNNTATNSSVPVAVDTTGVLAGKTVTAVVAGVSLTCAVAEGKASCWGYNVEGQLGNNSTTDSSVPVAVDTTGVLAGKTVTLLTSSNYHTCVVADALAACWGSNGGGQLGNNTATNSSVPVAVDTTGVMAGRTVVALSAGGTHTAALAITTPGAPTGVLGSPGDGKVTVSWTAPADDGGATITSSTATASPGGATCTTSGTSCDVTGLANGQAYTFTVVATNTAGDGPASDASDPVIPRTVPGAPTIVTGWPGDGRVTLSLTPPADDGGAAITGYEYSLDSGPWTPASVTLNYMFIDGLTNGVTYSVRLRAVNAAGPGEASAPFIFTASPPIVSGTVTDIVNGNPVADATVLVSVKTGGSTFATYEATTDANGSYSVEVEDRQFADVMAVATGVGYSPSFSVVGNLGLGGVTTLNIAIRPEGVVQGVVTSRGEPVGGATVKYLSPDWPPVPSTLPSVVTTGPDGKYRIGGLPLGYRGSLQIQAAGFHETTTEFFYVSSGETYTLDVELRALTPDAPTGLVAMAGDQSAVVSFDAPGDDGGSAISNYQVQVDDGSWVAQDPPVTGSPVTVRGLVNGVQVAVRLRAVNDAGPGAPSDPVSVTPRTTPGAPTGVSGSPGNKQVPVSWTAPGSDGGAAITSYTATASPSGATCTSAETSCTVNSLTNGQAYTFTVKATNSEGTGPASDPSDPVTPRTTPGAPTGVSGSPGDGKVAVSWTEPADDGGAAITSYTATASPGGATCTSAGRVATVNSG